MKYLFMVILVLTSSLVNGQANPDFLEGYVVLQNGDTLRGKVMDRDGSAFGGLLQKVRFKPDKGWRKKYKANQLKAYRRGEELFRSIWLSQETKYFKQFYFSRTGQGEQVFVKVIYDGSINLFHLEFTDEDNSDIRFVPLIKRSDTDELVRATQGIFGLKRKRLAEYFADCPPLTRALLMKEITTVNELIEIYVTNCSD